MKLTVKSIVHYFVLYCKVRSRENFALVVLIYIQYTVSGQTISNKVKQNEPFQSLEIIVSDCSSQKIPNIGLTLFYELSSRCFQFRLVQTALSCLMFIRASPPVVLFSKNLTVLGAKATLYLSMIYVVQNFSMCRFEYKILYSEPYCIPIAKFSTYRSSV